MAPKIMKKLNKVLVDKVLVSVAEVKEVAVEEVVKGRIDLGGDDQRDVIIGGAQYFNPNDIVGKIVIVLANLEPKTMAGVESNAMLLAADVDDKPYWLTVTEDVALGSHIK